MKDTGDVNRNEVSKGVTLTNNGGIAALSVTAVADLEGIPRVP